MASAGAIVGSSGGKIENCYYLEGVAGSFKGIGKSDVAGSAESRTAAQFKDGTVSEALGDAFTQIDDFPELKALLKKYELTVKSGTDVQACALLSTEGMRSVIIADLCPFFFSIFFLNSKEFSCIMI